MVRLPTRSAGPAQGEHPDRPFTGYKLAHAVLSADGSRTGFVGLTMGGSRVYGVTAEASCVWNRRHTPPRRWCGCGFYCLHSLADARALGCATENRAALLLEVSVSGRYIRYERGLRYSRQRVRVIRESRCACGNPGLTLGDAGTGLIGWRHLTPVCVHCAAGRRVLTLAEFIALLDGPVRVAPALAGVLPAGSLAGNPRLTDPLGDGMADPLFSAAPSRPADFGASGSGAPGLPVPAGIPDAADTAAGPGTSPFAVLAAEIALLHARLDDLQSRLDR